MSRAASTLRWTAALLLLAAGGPGAGATATPQLSLQIEGGPQHVGEPVELTLVAAGFARHPQPAIDLPTPSHGTLHLIDVSTRSRASSSASSGGQISRSHHTDYVYRLRYASARAGTVEVPPIAITQKRVTRKTEPASFDLADVPSSDDLRIRLSLLAPHVFLGQRVPVELEFWIARALQEPLQTYTLLVPLFDAPGLRFVDESSTAGGTDLQVELAGGTLQLDGHVREERVGGRRFVVVTARRTMIAQRSGTIDAEPASVVLSHASKFRRNFFGARRAMEVRKLKAVDRPVKLRVEAIPEEGRPESFAGAIGRDFSLDVTADRSVVQVGEPITLRFELRGDGDLGTAGMPRLGVRGLLDHGRFRVPSEAPTGVVDDHSKYFAARVRALAEDVSELPSLEYSWFDPRTQRFATTRSQPIALSVRPAVVVGASAVESRSSLRAQGEEPNGQHDLALLRSERPGTAAAAARGIARRAGTAAGADLAMEQRTTALLRNERPAAARWGAALGLHGTGLLLLAGAWFHRRRARRDPARAQRRAQLEAACAEVDAALDLAGRDAAAAVARALRRMLALAPSSASPALDAVLAECDARRFAPEADGADAPLPGELRDRARALAASIAAAEKPERA